MSRRDDSAWVGGGMSLKEYAVTILLTILLALGLKTFVLDVVYVPSPSMEGTLLPGDFLLVNKLMYGGAIRGGGLQTSAFRMPALRSVQRGDIVVFRFPGEPDASDEAAGALFVKRCFGQPGDLVGVRNGLLTVNGILYPQFEIDSHDRALATVTTPVALPRAGDTLTLSTAQYDWYRSILRQDGHTVDSANGSIAVDGVPLSRCVVRQNFFFMAGDNAPKSFDSRAWGPLAEDAVVGRAEAIYWSVNAPAGGPSSVRWSRVCTLVR